ncbi:MAG: hypothetical protein ACOCZR_00820 [Halanaerobiales bacterium]
MSDLDLEEQLKDIDKTNDGEDKTKIKVQIYKNGELMDETEGRALIGAVVIDDEKIGAIQAGRYSYEERLAATKVIEYETNNFMEREQLKKGMGKFMEKMSDLL